MKLKVVLTSDSPIVLPLHYNYTLQGFIYKNLDTIYSDFFHNSGFPHGKRYFKLLTFSRIFGKNKVIKRAKKVVFTPPVYFYVSCILEEALASYVKRLIKKDKLLLGKNRVSLMSAEVIEENVKDSIVTVKTLSPVTIHSTKDGKAIFYGPNQDDFYRLLTENLRKKAKIARVGDLDSIKVLPHPQSFYKKAVVLYKSYPVEAWKGRFIIEGPEEAIKVALSAGIGDRNSQGFGMVILERM